MVSIAVIGAGPKAAAIAAKAEVLNKTNDIGFKITVFERGDIGGNWIGPDSYTNGKQLLCTPAERDVGFPYDTTPGDDVPKEMQAEYSWMAYSVEKGDQNYSDWINRGGQRATHADFARYVEHVLNKSGAKCEEMTEVVGLRAHRKKWIVKTRRNSVSPPSDYNDEFDGVVVTGPGPAKRVRSEPSHIPGLYDCENVWGKLSEVKGRLRARTEDLVIIGGGGAAAAIAAWLVESGFKDHPIRFVAKQATFYSRGGGFFENRVFDDEELWTLLSEREQKEFIDRITRGVVWEAVYDRLAQANNIAITPGRATSVFPAPKPDKLPNKPEPLDLLTVQYTPAADGPDKEIEASVVIDASGFDRWWFRELLPAPHNSIARLEKAAKKMERNLSLPLAGLPPLHVPNVADVIGPGYASLMVLGRMADRVLMDYGEFS